MGQGKRYEHADQRYLQDIGRYELLDAEREKELGMKKAERELEQIPGKVPTIEELSEHLGISQEQVAFLYSFQGTPDSLDRVVGEDEDSSLSDILSCGTAESAEDIVMKKLEKEEMHDLLNECLNDRENMIVTKRFGMDGEEKQTLAQLGGSMDLSRERIRQIERNALRKMKGKARKIAG